MLILGPWRRGLPLLGGGEQAVIASRPRTRMRDRTHRGAILTLLVPPMLKSVISVGEDFSAVARSQRHPGRDIDAVGQKVDRAVSEGERYAVAMRAPGSIGIEDASCIGASLPGVAHQQGHLGAEIPRIHEERVQSPRRA